MAAVLWVIKLIPFISGMVNGLMDRGVDVMDMSDVAREFRERQETLLTGIQAGGGRGREGGVGGGGVGGGGVGGGVGGVGRGGRMGGIGTVNRRRRVGGSMG